MNDFQSCAFIKLMCTSVVCLEAQCTRRSGAADHEGRCIEQMARCALSSSTHIRGDLRNFFFFFLLLPNLTPSNITSANRYQTAFTPILSHKSLDMRLPPVTLIASALLVGNAHAGPIAWCLCQALCGAGFVTLRCWGAFFRS